MFRLQVSRSIELKQFELSEASGLYALADQNRVYLREWLPWVDRTHSSEEVREFIARSISQYEAGQGPNTGIRIDGVLVGSIGCHPIDWGNRKTSIGYWIDSAHQGKGVMTQCCRALLQYLFGELGLHRVVIQCATGNTKSCAIPARLGFTREGVARESEWVNDHWVDLVVWAITETEWAATRRP
jgi:ribosomal-protein-serine acetyltransferase